MRVVRFIVYMLIILSASSVQAVEIPAISLNEGFNEIALSISNKYFADLKNVTVEIAPNVLPGWLTVQKDVTSIDIQKGEKAEKKLSINFYVKDAPQKAIAELPFMLKDDSGNTWNFTVLLNVNSGMPLSNALYDNFPNPFNPVTTIRYSLKENLHTRLIIYNSLGQQIRTLVDSPQTAGIHTLKWDGKNDYGQKVSSGLYFYTLKSGSFIHTKRMMLLE